MGKKGQEWRNRVAPWDGDEERESNRGVVGKGHEIGKEKGRWGRCPKERRGRDPTEGRKGRDRA